MDGVTIKMESACAMMDLLETIVTKNARMVDLVMIRLPLSARAL
jgi:hypothetical protein